MLIFQQKFVYKIRQPVGAEATQVSEAEAAVRLAAVTVPPAVELWQAVTLQRMQLQQYQNQQWWMVQVQHHCLYHPSYLSQQTKCCQLQWIHQAY
jgi:hypothetical protein